MASKFPVWSQCPRASVGFAATSMNHGCPTSQTPGLTGSTPRSCVHASNGHSQVRSVVGPPNIVAAGGQVSILSFLPHSSSNSWTMFGRVRDLSCLTGHCNRSELLPSPTVFESVVCIHLTSTLMPGFPTDCCIVTSQSMIFTPPGSLFNVVTYWFINHLNTNSS